MFCCNKLGMSVVGHHWLQHILIMAECFVLHSVEHLSNTYVVIFFSIEDVNIVVNIVILSINTKFNVSWHNKCLLADHQKL